MNLNPASVHMQVLSRGDGMFLVPLVYDGPASAELAHAIRQSAAAGGVQAIVQETSAGRVLLRSQAHTEAVLIGPDPDRLRELALSIDRAVERYNTLYPALVDAALSL